MFVDFDRAGMRLMRICLPFLHTLPVDKAVGIVDEKGQKAKDHRQIGNTFNRSEHPKPDQHYVVDGVADCIIGAA